MYNVLLFTAIHLQQASTLYVFFLSTMTTTTKKKTTTTKKKTAPRKKKGKKKGILRSVNGFMLWVCVGVIAIVYIIFFYKTFVGPYSFRWKALYGNVTYPKGKVRGIDISHYQDEVNWNKVRNASIQGSPVSFVFVKATEGTNILDENFNQNFYNAKKNDIVRGAYHFFSTTSSGKAQAKYFCKMVQLDEKDLPPVLDVEKIGDYTPKKLQKEVKAWMDAVEKHYGVKPILYTYYKFKQSYLNTPEFDKYPYWIAHYYVDSLEYKGSWKFWQHTDAGKVDGIKGDVDINVFNGDYQDLMDLTIKSEY